VTEFVRINRRLFLARLGKGTMALAVLGACGSNTGGPSTTSAGSTTGPASTAATTTYVVVRGSEAAVVDTGVSGSEGSIEAALATVDLGWDAVGHVILTHHHPDHVGSMPAVLNAAAAATGYIGEGDLDNVSGPRELVGVVEGDDVFGLTVIGTPGHTAGHISLLDSLASVLIAGDALNGDNGGVAGPTPRFSEDHDQAIATVGKMAGYEYETLYFGHGEPVLEGAAGMVAELAENQ
jgi:glyoxylase-like metal-dependent hydrolase (beta-lactamase superfamily II)